MDISFRISAPHRSSRYLDVEMKIDGIQSDEIVLELPSWRPGRYEIGNFARNIRKWQSYNGNGEMLPFRKTARDSWQVSLEGSKSLTIHYDYYCEQADAGGCYVDDDLIYVNPIHCFLFVRENLHEPCTLEVDVPNGYQFAGALTKKGSNNFSFKNFHELYDTPFMTGTSFHMEKYKSGDKTFYIWLHGKCNPEWERIIKHFRAFSDEQHKTMKDFPFEEFHFLVLVLPYKFYHGVEHLHSTVLALGPGFQLMNDPLYVDFMGVASHELFHTWNVKTIRPAEMYPYDYKKENYSRLGYVYEGVTTYYGDLFLVRSGVYSVEQYFEEVNIRLQKHFDNPGRSNLSVADSSFDTWLDGYTPGVPGRKTSIYDEGCLTALMTDLLIRRKTKNASSLDDVMRTLYNDFGKKNRGYTDHDYLSICEHVAGKSMADFFLDFVYGTENYEPLLSELLSFAGCKLNVKPSPEASERFYGFRVTKEKSPPQCLSVAPDSPAFHAGLNKGFEIIAVNGMKAENLQAILRSLGSEEITLTVVSPMNAMREIRMTKSKNEFFQRYSVTRQNNPGREKSEAFRAWLKQEHAEVGLEKA